MLWYAGRAFHRADRRARARPRCRTEAADGLRRAVDLFEKHFPQLAGKSGLRVIGRAFADVFVGQARSGSRDLRRILAERPVDAMLI